MNEQQLKRLIQITSKIAGILAEATYADGIEDEIDIKVAGELITKYHEMRIDIENEDLTHNQHDTLASIAKEMAYSLGTVNAMEATDALSVEWQNDMANLLARYHALPDLAAHNAEEIDKALRVYQLVSLQLDGMDVLQVVEMAAKYKEMQRHKDQCEWCDKNIEGCGNHIAAAGKKVTFTDKLNRKRGEA